MYLRFSMVLLVVVLLFSTGCQKAIVTPDTDMPSSPDTPINNNGQARLSYGNDLFFLRNQSSNQIVSPVSKPAAAGYFKAIPMGLTIDSITGNIDITQSEAGLRYKIYYIGTTGNLLDSVKLVISGIDYMDAIYEIAATPVAYDTAFPIYNARPEIPLPCGDDDEDGDGDLDDDDNACVFDETDLDNDGNDDIAGVIQDKLLVDIKKGTIDAEASFHAGIFGSSNPANGISKDFTFYYRLQDASNRALNKITVRVYHYRTRNDIPQSLLDTLNLRATVSAAANSRPSGNTRPVTETIAGIPDIFYRPDYALKPKRPPIIIIVSE